MIILRQISIFIHKTVMLQLLISTHCQPHVCNKCPSQFCFVKNKTTISSVRNLMLTFQTRKCFVSSQICLDCIIGLDLFRQQEVLRYAKKTNVTECSLQWPVWGYFNSNTFFYEENLKNQNYHQLVFLSSSLIYIYI